MSSPINDLLKNITQIPKKTEYWFVSRNSINPEGFTLHSLLRSIQ